MSDPWFSGETKWRAGGPYGTNLGDIWLGENSEIQRKLDAEGKGMVLVHEVMDKDGEIQECLYVTDNQEIIEEARAGTAKYIAQKASEN